MNDVPGGTDEGDPEDDKKYCPQGTMWKISFADVDAASSLAGFISPTSLLNYQLSQVDVSLNFANLTNGAVGETVGHSITLDDDGAGHGWFIGSTPDSNDEFLATSNPRACVFSLMADYRTLIRSHAFERQRVNVVTQPSV